MLQALAWLQEAIAAQIEVPPLPEILTGVGSTWGCVPYQAAILQNRPENASIFKPFILAMRKSRHGGRGRGLFGQDWGDGSVSKACESQ